MKLPFLTPQHLSAFPPLIRERGARYFLDERVQLIRADPLGVHARVRGTVSYMVSIEPARGGLVRWNCSCPYAMDHGRCKHMYAVALAAQPSTSAESAERIRARKPRTPLWQSRLSGVRRQLADHAKRRRYGRPDDARAEAPLQEPVEYRLQYDQLRASGHVLVEVHPSDGRVFSDVAWLRSADRTDRRIARLLLGAEAAGPYAGSRPPSSLRRFTIPPPLYGTLLRRILETGRCTLLTEPTPKDGRVAAVWDPGGAWTVRFAVEPVEASEEGGPAWKLAGWLVRGEERRPLEEALVVTALGLAATKDGFQRLRVGGSWPLVFALRKDGPLVVPPEGLFDLTAQLALLPERTPVELPEGVALEQAHPTPSPRLVIRQPDPRSHSPQLPIKLSFDYDGLAVPEGKPVRRLIDRAKKRIVHRNPERERAARERLTELGAALRNAWARPGSQLVLHPKRLQEVVLTLVEEGWQVEADGRLHRAATATDARISSGIDWFDLEGAIAYGDQQASLVDALAALRRGEHTVELGDGSAGILPMDWLSRYAPLADLASADDGDGKGARIRFRRGQAALLDALLAEQPEVRVDETFARLRNRLRGFERVKPAAPPRGFKGELRPYQREGLGWMAFLRGLELGGCLADDMGLGKTVQVLALLERRRQEGAWPSLVVVPKSLVHNWISEAARFTPRLRVRNYTGPDRHRERLDSESCDLVISTYGTLRRDAPELASFPFDYVILDEAQAIKNAGSASAKAVRLLNAPHRLALSGTPVENHLGELWSLFEFLNPGLLGSAKAFASLRPGIKGGTPDEATRTLLARAVRPFLLRRTKQQVAPELPARTEQTILVELEGEQRKLYDQLRDHYRGTLLERVGNVGLARSKMHVLEALLRLRQAALHPGLVDAKKAGAPSAKLPLLLETLQEVVDEGHRALVFSQFTSFLAHVREALERAGIAYEYLDGSTRDRRERVDRFQQEGGPPVFLISLRAGGHGLNLTAADYVFLLDPWWNPAVEAQAIDRTHRIGQTKPVVAMRLIAKDTVEEKVLTLQQSKRELADAVLGEDAGLLSKITREDLELLLG